MAAFVKETRRTQAHGHERIVSLMRLVGVRGGHRAAEAVPHRDVIWSRKKARPPGQVIRALPCGADHKALCRSSRVKCRVPSFLLNAVSVVGPRVTGFTSPGFPLPSKTARRRPVGTGRRTETVLGALHLAEEVATIGGQVASARPPSCDAGSEGALGQRRRPATGA
jgi:hypothetical protein